MRNWGIVIAIAGFLVAVPLALGQGVGDAGRVVEMGAFARPQVGVPTTDPAFGTTIVRVADSSERGVFSTHVYSQLQALSHDGRYLLLTMEEGYEIRRVEDLAVVSGVDFSGWNDPRWHPQRPHAIVHFDSNDDTTVLVELTDVEARTRETLFTFPARYERVRVAQSFDELSKDGRWLAGLFSRDDGDTAIVALDIESGRLGAELSIGDLYAAGGPCAPDPEWGVIEPDWIGVSPLGRYLVVQWTRDGTERCSGLETFDIETGAFVGRAYEGHQHGDLGVDVDGSEFFMTFEISDAENSGRPGIATRALPGPQTASPPRHLLSIDWAVDGGGHISCQGPRGACLVSYGGTDGDEWVPFERELFLLRTDGTVLRIAHHRSSECGYWVQPRGSISEDGRYVIFASDWGLGASQSSCARWGSDMGVGDPYIIDLGTDAQLSPGTSNPVPPTPPSEAGAPPAPTDEVTPTGLATSPPLTGDPPREIETPGPGALAVAAVLVAIALARRRT